MNLEDFMNKHGENLPTVRIKKVTLHDFKSVGYGEITFNCGREKIPCGTEADILGLYGQNGSGKTSFIEALSILQYVMSGYSVPNAYTDCIAIDKDYSKLEFLFDLQYPDGVIREALYSFCISKEELSDDELKNRYKNNDGTLDNYGYGVSPSEYKIVIFDEKFYLQWEGSSKRQLIIDTSSKDFPFIPNTKRKEIIGKDQKAIMTLEFNKSKTRKESRSFIFLPSTLEQLLTSSEDSVYCSVLAELNLFADQYLYVVDTKHTGFVSLNLMIPIFTQYRGVLELDLRQPQAVNNNTLDKIKEDIANISSVLTQFVPGLSIGIKDIVPTIDKKGRDATLIMVMSYRDGKEIPLRDESDGIRRIVSILSLIILAFNQQSTTVAIDEFDSGIFEYLLGEILEIMEEYGKGQLIFTSHNLRPLEVINKKYLWFTTTNPQNRYIRLKNISQTNNLRDTYFREILMGEQEEEIYNRTKKYKIVSALRKAMVR